MLKNTRLDLLLPEFAPPSLCPRSFPSTWNAFPSFTFPFQCNDTCICGKSLWAKTERGRMEEQKMARKAEEWAD